MFNKKREEEGIKIALLGNPGVGKTCIISKYKDDTFNENKVEINGINYSGKTIKIRGKEVELTIWEIPSQEKFQSMSNYFYRDANVICLVYDITNQDSFNSLQNKWIKDVKNYGEKYNILAVVGNKLDLFEKKQVTEDEGEKFAHGINAIFMLTSAKTGDGIEELFYTLAGKYHDPEYKFEVKEMKGERDQPFILNNKNNDGCCKKKCC